MSREFYDYLTKRTIGFFDSYPLKSGEKFILKFDNKDEVNEYYTSFKSVLSSLNRSVTYTRTDDDVFQTESFRTSSGKQLILIPEINITNAYLTRIRNTVSENQALLIICYNPIDSIAGGTESLQKEGMPFHKTRMMEDIQETIRISEMGNGDKQVLYFDLDSKKNADFMDMYSLSDYAGILSILNKGSLENDDYKAFGLFADPELNTIGKYDDKELRARITENHKSYKKIDDSIKYGNIESDLEKEHTDKFISKIKKSGSVDHWDKGIEYSDVVNDQKEKRIRVSHLKLRKPKFQRNYLHLEKI